MEPSRTGFTTQVKGEKQRIKHWYGARYKAICTLRERILKYYVERKQMIKIIILKCSRGAIRYCNKIGYEKVIQFLDICIDKLCMLRPAIERDKGRYCQLSCRAYVFIWP